MSTPPRSPMMEILLGMVKKRLGSGKPVTGIRLFRMWDRKVLLLHDVVEGVLQKRDKGVEEAQLIATHGCFDYGQLVTFLGNTSTILLLGQERGASPMIEVHRFWKSGGLRRLDDAALSEGVNLFIGRFTKPGLLLLDSSLREFLRKEVRGITEMEAGYLKAMGVKSHSTKLLENGELQKLAVDTLMLAESEGDLSEPTLTSTPVRSILRKP